MMGAEDYSALPFNRWLEQNPAEDPWSAMKVQENENSDITATRQNERDISRE